MSRNIADLKNECDGHGLTVAPAGKKMAKSDYETALRDFYWQRDHAGEVMADQISPMLARNAKDLSAAEQAQLLTDGSGFVAQVKINGCRAIMRFRNPSAGRINHLTSRRISDETYRYNELHDVMPHYRDLDLGTEWEDTVIDGEVLMCRAVVNTEGVVTKNILQATAATLNCGVEKSLRIQAAHGKLVLHVFDLLRYKGKDVRHLGYVQRYRLLTEVATRVQQVLGDLPCECTVCNHQG